MSDGDVLVVDDNPGDIRFIEEAFKVSQLSPTIHALHTTDAALDFVHQRNEYGDAPVPDVALLDWNLSGSTSREVVRAIESAASHLPVVVMTGSGTELTKVKSEVSRADTCIEKPTTSERYIELLRPYLTNR